MSCRSASIEICSGIPSLHSVSRKRQYTQETSPVHALCSLAYTVYKNTLRNGELLLLCCNESSSQDPRDGCVTRFLPSAAMCHRLCDTQPQTAGIQTKSRGALFVGRYDAYYAFTGMSDDAATSSGICEAANPKYPARRKRATERHNRPVQVLSLIHI